MRNTTLPRNYRSAHVRPAKSSVDGLGGVPFARIALAWLAAALFAVVMAVPASAAPLPSLLLRTPANEEAGQGSGQLAGANGGIAADPNTGHIFAADGRNSRVSEFDSFGQFIKVWGWGVTDGAAAPQICAAPASCQEGIVGSGAGQFANNLLGGVALDSSGDVYVGDIENYRVQKFNSAGQFIWMVGGEVNKTKVAERVAQEANAEPVMVTVEEENFCSATSGDTCGIGTVGLKQGQLSDTGCPYCIAIGSGDALFVASHDRIQEFGPDGSFGGEVKLSGALAGEFIQSFAMDQTDNFYFTFSSGLGGSGRKDEVVKLAPSGTLVASFAADVPSAVALDDAGNLYIQINPLPGFDERREIIEYAPDGTALIPAGSGFALQTGGVGSPVEDGVLLTGLATNTVTNAGGVDIYIGQSALQRSLIAAYGPAPDKWPAPNFPPRIKAQYAVSVQTNSATLGAEINPEFWADTKYYVEYGSARCSEGGCNTKVPAPPGAELKGGVVNTPTATKGLLLQGLQPGTVYYYRFVAQSSGGGPTVGVGPGEAEGSFATRKTVTAANTSCANQVFRIGASALLPDCRAYEMVSPVDKNNTDIISLININSNPAALNQSASNGEKLTYSTSQGFGEVQGVPYVSQYIATRGPSGWSSAGITPSQGISPVPAGRRIDVEFRAFTPDLCSSVLVHPTDPPLAPGAAEGYLNIYSRQNCGPATYSAVTNATPPTRDPVTYTPDPQGLSADGHCSVFAAEDKLTADAAPGTVPKGSVRQVYESCGGALRLISVLPNGKANTTGASTGTANLSYDFRANNDARALSADGSRVYWTASGEGVGPLYVRVNSEQEQSKVSAGKCTEKVKACTIRVSQAVSGDDARFWGASPDGSSAFFSIEDSTSAFDGDLYQFDLASEEATQIATNMVGVMGSNEDASRIAFVSSDVLTAGANAEGKTPAADAPNLYFVDLTKSGADRYRFIGTLSKADAVTNTTVALTPINRMPYKKTSRLSPDGLHVAFMSSASLTGYENVDMVSGAADAGIFVYDAGASGGQGGLHCISCNPTGQRPVGRNIPVEGGPSGTWGAALLPTYATELYGSRVISDDGSRVFFNSYEQLAPRDANGKADVYEWEALGAGDCDQADSAFSVSSGGCINLISSGESPTDSEFVDASPDGRDVFFATASSLLPQDPGLVDLYDAREGGGYPPPAGQVPACEGEACAGPPAQPIDPTPASAVFNGPGNVGKKKAPCSKGKVRRKGRCVAKKSHKKAKHPKQASKNRGAGK